MKRINVEFSDEEFERLTTRRKKLQWHDFIMLLADHNFKIVSEPDYILEPDEFGRL